MAKRNQTPKAANAPKAPKQKDPSPVPAPVGDVDFSAPAPIAQPEGTPPNGEPEQPPPVDNDHIAPGSEKFSEPPEEKAKAPVVPTKTVTPTESIRVQLNGQLERLHKLPQSRGVQKSIAAVKRSIADLK